MLRGTSASVRMQPHDLAFLLAGLLEQRRLAGGRSCASCRGRQHSGGWTPPPMHPDVSMPPALMTLRPDVAPYAPATNDRIPLARPRELLQLRDGASLRSRRRTGSPRAVRPHRDDARLQRPVSRSADPGGRGLDDRRATSRTAPTSRRPSTGTACGSTIGSTASPHVTQDPVPPGRLVRVPRALPRCRDLLVSPASSRGRAAGPRPLRQPARAVARPRVLRAGAIAKKC